MVKNLVKAIVAGVVVAGATIGSLTVFNKVLDKKSNKAENFEDSFEEDSTVMFEKADSDILDETMTAQNLNPAYDENTPEDERPASNFSDLNQEFVKEDDLAPVPDEDVEIAGVSAL